MSLSSYWSSETANSSKKLVPVSFPPRGLKQQAWPWPLWLRWLSMLLPSEKSLVWFLVRAHAWVAGSIPGGQEATGRCFLLTSVFLSLSFSIPSPLSKNKYIKHLKKIKQQACVIWVSVDQEFGLSLAEFFWLQLRCCQSCSHINALMGKDPLLRSLL